MLINEVLIFSLIKDSQTLFTFIPFSEILFESGKYVKYCKLADVMWKLTAIIPISYLY